MKPNTYFRPGVELLAYLDGNLSSYGRDDPNLLVTEFFLPWWRGTKQPIRNNTYLSYMTLTDALVKHRLQLQDAGVSGLFTQPDISSRLNKPLHSWHPEGHANLDNPCTRCRLYRAITFGTMDKLRDWENYAQGMAVANFGEADIGMRRSSGLYELYEHVLKKEVELEQSPGPGTIADSDSDSDSGFPIRRAAGGNKGTRKGKRKAKGKGKTKKVSKVAEHVRTDAEKQLHESRAGRAFGQVDSKWTWGVDLDSRDIWDMVRGADKFLQVPHSGYDDELKTGSVRSSSPIPNPNDIEDRDEPGILFDELTHNPFIRELRPDEFPIAFAFPTLHYMAAGESDSGLELPPPSSSDEDTQPMIPEGSRPPRPWLGPPTEGYVQLPASTPKVLAKKVLSMAAEASHNLEMMSDPADISGPEPEPNSMLRPRDVFHRDFADNWDSDIFMDVASSYGSDQEIELGTLGMDSGATAKDSIYGLVAPDLPDDSDEEIEVGNLDREVESGMWAEDTSTELLGLAEPDSPDDSDTQIEVGDLGLVASESDDEFEVGNIGLESVATGMWAESDIDDFEPRARVRIILPRVNPETGVYTADSFANVPNELLD